jgi:hypothetical protein
LQILTGSRDFYQPGGKGSKNCAIRGGFQAGFPL